MTRQTTEPDRLRIRALAFESHLTARQISAQTGFTPRQVRKAMVSLKPGERSGRKPTLSDAEQSELIDFIGSSLKARRMTYLELSQSLFQGRHGEFAIRATLRRLGYKRCIARRKPLLSQRNRALRLRFAQEHLHWTQRQWDEILWSDETWITHGRHRKIFITRRPGEELDPFCVNETEQRKTGWMFWGCFSGAGKGPAIFWGKDWGMIGAESYQRIIPVVDGWIRLLRQTHPCPVTCFMQDNAPGHAAASTIQEMGDRNINRLIWPPCSPDLNPIEKCWNLMKDYLSAVYGNEQKPSYDELRRQVKEAWDAIPDAFLQDELSQMHEKLQAVIDAEGGHTMF